MTSPAGLGADEARLSISKSTHRVAEADTIFEEQVDDMVGGVLMIT